MGNLVRRRSASAGTSCESSPRPSCARAPGLVLSGAIDGCVLSSAGALCWMRSAMCWPGAAALLLWAGLGLARDYPFRDPTLPWEQRLDDLIGRLTLGELVLQVRRGSLQPAQQPH